MKSNIFVSACLLGHNVRYDGRAKTFAHSLVDTWRSQGRLVTICPEVAAGFSTPRPPAEIAPGADANMVLEGTGRVHDRTGLDVTGRFLAGAEIALDVALANNCRFALLTDGSPSCGSTRVHVGRFNGRTRQGMGVVAARFVEAGIAVFAESGIEDLAKAVAAHDALAGAGA